MVLTGSSLGLLGIRCPFSPSSSPADSRRGRGSPRRGTFGARLRPPVTSAGAAVGAGTGRAAGRATGSKIGSSTGAGSSSGKSC